MNKLVERFSKIVKGTLSGFDRIVFKGIILPLMSSKEVMKFCARKGILNKNYKDWMMKQSIEIVNAADSYSKENCGYGITPIPSWRIRKEELANDRQQKEKIKQGLLGVWSCVESGSSYRAKFSKSSGYPQLQNYATRCKHLYFYFDHSQYGFMNIRLQTWFPYHVQICMNGREWLRRSLEQQGIDFVVKGNKFMHIDDYKKSQEFLDKQPVAKFAEILKGFVPIVFPGASEILGPNLSYYWTMWQSEWATDLIFTAPKDLHSISGALLRHAHISGTSTSVLRYLDRPLKKSGIPDSRSNDHVTTQLMSFNDGIRVRHWVDRNSVKIYNEQNVLRIETTINDPKKFKAHRHILGQSGEDKPKKILPLRKGVMDTPIRAKISQDVNNRLMNDLSTIKDTTPVHELIDTISTHRIKNSKRYRALTPTGKDRDILTVLSNPNLRISGFSNKMLRSELTKLDFGAKRTEKQLSAKISRCLRLLRVHGVVRKLPRQNRYQLTVKGVKLTLILNGFLAASTEQLIDMAA